MTRLLKATALIAALAPAFAAAESITLEMPMQGAALHAEGVDMSVYYLTLGDGAYEVVATYATRGNPAEPHRLVMALKDGDATRFGLPGQRGTLYAFERQGTEVTVRASAIEGNDTSVQAAQM